MSGITSMMGSEVLSAGGDLHLVADPGEERRDGAADSSRSDDANSHAQILGVLPVAARDALPMGSASESSAERASAPAPTSTAGIAAST